MHCLQMYGGAFGLIDYEHSGVADAVPPFQPLYHYPPECQGRRKPYSTAADVYSVGYLMRDIGIGLDSKAHALYQLLTAHDLALRPSARSALSDPMVGGGMIAMQSPECICRAYSIDRAWRLEAIGPPARSSVCAMCS